MHTFISQERQAGAKPSGIDVGLAFLENLQRTLVKLFDLPSAVGTWESECPLPLLQVKRLRTRERPWLA